MYHGSCGRRSAAPPSYLKEMRRFLLLITLVAGFATSALAFGYAASGAPGVPSGVACTSTQELVVVDLDNVRHRHILRHVFDARRKGKPRILHVRRYEATANRRQSLRGIPTRRGFDRDEYPPAMSDEGGLGASVRYIESAENRSAGSVMKSQLARYCNEQRFIVERWRNR
jgi:hypothetical protein